MNIGILANNMKQIGRISTILSYHPDCKIKMVGVLGEVPNRDVFEKQIKNWGAGELPMNRVRLTQLISQAKLAEEIREHALNLLIFSSEFIPVAARLATERLSMVNFSNELFEKEPVRFLFMIKRLLKP